MPEFIFQNQSSDITEKFYTLMGHEDFVDEQGYPRSEQASSDQVVAKCIQNKKSKNIQQSNNYYTYYIKVSPNNMIYNPIELYSAIENKRQFEFIDNVCKDKWTFKEVSSITFNKYLNFLTTKNIAWLKDAERDLK